MPSPDVLAAFITKVESNAYAEAIEGSYALDGARTRIEELAYQRWEGDAIVEEKFFYDPRQLAPRD